VTVAVFAARDHHRAHLRPVADVLGVAVGERARATTLADVAVVASYGDLANARRSGYRRIVLMQHGAGQSYGGDRRTARHPAYPGGDDNDDVGLFLVPNEHAADRWAARYAHACVEVVGCPRIDELRAGAWAASTVGVGGAPTVAVSFHWNYHGIPEMRSAFDWYRDAVAALPRTHRVIGHAHPKRRDLARWYADHNIEYVASFDDVVARADVYVTDNSSTLFEFAASGRPVVVLNAPWYRRDVDHGLRFWTASFVGVGVDDPSELPTAIDDALRDNVGRQHLRGQVLDHVYTHRDGTSAARAAAAIVRFAA
jgi:hypothetical protein